MKAVADTKGWAFSWGTSGRGGLSCRPAVIIINSRAIAFMSAVYLCCCGGGTTPATLASAPPRDERAIRHPPGVVMDPIAKLPPAQDMASSGEGVVVLQTPTDTTRAFDVVRRFFQAIQAESLPGLNELLPENAVATFGPNTGRQSARAAWQARFARLDYGLLGGRPVHRDRDIEFYREGAALAPFGGRLPIAVMGHDVLLRIPILNPRVGTSQLFGQEMWILLRPSENGYSIAELVETLQLP